MSRAGSLWMTALLSAPFVVGGGCSPKVDLGAMNVCGDQGVICDLDGGFSDATLPIGDPQYPEFDRAAFEHISAGLEGEWHGVVAGIEMIFSPFEMRFIPGDEEGSGDFLVECVASRFCVPIGGFQGNRASGRYRVLYADGNRAGQGEFTWTEGEGRSAKFTNLLLQRSDEVLFFVVDIWLGGSFQFVMQRGPWPDAGVTADQGESLGNPDAPRPSVDAGTSAP